MPTDPPTADRLPWPLTDRAELRDALVAAYSEQHRGYHDLRHLTEVLRRLDELGAGTDRELLLAAWYHDVVHDAAGRNEERSAQRAERELADTPADAAEVARLVRVTEHHDPDETDHRGRLLCDADLAILAADERRYAAYTAGVRKEYAHLPEDEFRRGRLAVLRGLAGREHLFHTGIARHRWDARARRNLLREIAGLERGEPEDPP